MRKLALGVLGAFVLLIGVVVFVAHTARSDSSQQIVLKPAQQEMLNKVDASIDEYKKSAEDRLRQMMDQREAVLIGIVSSTEEIAPAGLEWRKLWDVKKVDGKYRFERVPEKPQAATTGEQR